ncbi:MULTISPECIES: ABC transporter substrate-binding protein [Bosea]|jgi:branched-chain amino acid transport system substrate-binding protein|uniref:ABC transporter substrate-binding protein n=1 Tax=Bosea TaxID=85413 RepID=UPI00214FA604|nr:MULTISPECIES: ABC transporter substrate-binding protein [Bosea]MCR4524734.1 ABC transporter substrate-binding protein [Bosea sp. 47.2.35]MDR6831633.1 branched-chain amino acid transport system substrate-binding protein [Bosea robiniae]MDR6898336.1 branched-chain amino acid transport system substrate-binding protein [Bosea sp. BE109]MDR7141739.1 branched-chain amino acid transport system substrate-binding protein [Bosea sp. BE168]MDR7178343.1 branched-chain amino acid transport system substr
MKLKTILATTALATLMAVPALAQQITVKAGVLNDRSGLYADLSGEGSVIAARMAVEDFKAADKGIKVEIVSADHQNKPDVGSTIARQWYDQDGVDLILDVPTSSVALAVSQITKEKNKVHINSGAATSDLTGKACNANTIHWTYDTYALAQGTGGAMVKAGGDSWFFLTADYAFGHALERDTSAVVTKAGGKVLGAVRTPFPGTDFSSFLLQAQASKAKVIGLANAGGDTINSIKQAGEFGIVAGGQKLAGLLVFLTDVHSLGLQAAQGLVLTESFYWDSNDGTRAWSDRFSKLNGGKRPTMVQAGVYSGMLHYLKAVEAAKSKDAGAVVAKMKEMPTDDPLFGKGSVRADGRKMHNMYLFEVKKPAESKGTWDYYKQLAVLPAEQAFRPLAESECPLVKK